MGEAREEAEWLRTASIMALLANIHRDPKKSEAFDVSRFMPKRGPTERPNMASLRSHFTGRTAKGAG